MISFVVSGPSVPFSWGSRGNGRFIPKRQRDYMNLVASIAKRAMVGVEKIEGPVRLEVKFWYEPPASWSRAKRGRANWKTSKPDSTNLIKLLEDSLTGIVWKDDAQVCSHVVDKRYGIRAETIVTVLPLGVEP